MPVTITSLAKKLGIKSQDLKDRIGTLGFKLKKTQREIDDDLADLVFNEINTPLKEAETEKSEAEIYDEIYEKQIQKEIIKSQRKQTAGKEVAKEIKTTPDISITPTEEVKTYKKNIEIPGAITVKEFAEKTGISAAKIIGELMKNGILASINQQIDFETAAIVADEFNVKIKRIRESASIEDMMEGNLKNLLKEDDRADLKERSPIVVVMGHVDHGKTQLLDYIRNTKVVAQESGGITQHIGAYEVEKNHKKITFIDTPGHEAFTAMRARGARVTDIAILVIAADEGVKEQTIEALNHAKEAEVPIIVAINKVDKREANIDKVKAQLSEYGLQPEEWGGKTIMEPVSAITGQGVEKLLDDILLVAEVTELKANPNRPGVATVIEANLDPNLGPTATIIVNTGTVKVMDAIVVGCTSGRIKIMKNSAHKNTRTLGPSGCALIAGLHETPFAGDILQVMSDEKAARKKASQIKELLRLKQYKTGGIAIDEIIARINEGKMKTLKVILKADTKGTLEAIRESLSKIRSEEVATQIIHSGVGQVTESDVLMASASHGIVIGFHSKPNLNVKRLAERENVEILYYEIIYQMTDELKKLLSGLIEPEIVEVIFGKLEVKKVFRTEKKEMIIGGKVIEGKIQNKAKFRLFRASKQIATGEIQSLKSGSEAADEIANGKECGLKVNMTERILEGDIIEVYGFEKHIKKL